MKPNKESSNRSAPLRARRRILLAMDIGAFTAERRHGVAQYAREANWILETRLMAFLSQGKHEEYLASVKFDGIIALLFGTNSLLVRTVLNAGVPVVDMWQDLPDLKIPRVWLDHRAVGQMAAEHLSDLGLKNLLFYSHSVDRRIAVIRRDGFFQTAESRGVRARELWWEGQSVYAPGQDRISWLAEQIRSMGLPLGVFAVNDAVAGDILDACEQGGFRIPEDVAVIGCDNDPILSELGRIPLSSIDLARERIGYEAAALLDRLMNNEPAPAEPILIGPTRVVPRRSTQILAVKDPDVAQAIHYIQDHFREPISVAEVANSTYLSRRRLQDRFRTELGHGISDEISRQRVQFAQKLLAESKHKITTIATLAGFSSVHHMSKVFRRTLGTSPKQMRTHFHASTGPGI